VNEKAADFEAQLAAMRSVMEALKPLDDHGKTSVLDWVDRQLGRNSVRNETIAGAANVEQRSSTRDGTVSMVAQKIGARSARDLFLAAAAHLTLYQGKDSFTKEELVGCAKEGRSWKVEYRNQIAMSITRMLKAGVLFERARNVFSLSDSALADLEGKLSA
jgi:hypothetical protein